MKKIWTAGLAVLTLLSLYGEFRIGEGHGPHHWWNAVPGFWILFGFAGCVLLILLAKTLGRILLNRRGSYYDD